MSPRKKKQPIITTFERLNAETDPNFYFSTYRYFEHRLDRSYDEEDPGQVVHPNGSLVASFDRPFLAAACAEVLRLTWEAQREAA